MKTIVATLLVVLSCTGSWADELNDLPDLACAQASSALERDQIGCPDVDGAATLPRAAVSPLDRVEDD
ncbi:MULTISPECIES: hypothetical protein [unclassified Methylobacterium]|uniref:hypothetical protein n=1 Tax=unclassified Methylobacterium TaxID=2615210 RepID=UPI002269CC47|nr:MULTISPECIES: hypothetical protein [unclassified Methylobacterium]